MKTIYQEIKATNKRIHEIKEVVSMTNCITADERVELVELERKLNKLIKKL